MSHFRITLVTVEIILQFSFQFQLLHMLTALSVTLFLNICFSLSGFLSEEHPEEHGVHVPPGQSLCHQQSDEEPVSVMSTAEVPGCGHV